MWGDLMVYINGYKYKTIISVVVTMVDIEYKNKI